MKTKHWIILFSALLLAAALAHILLTNAPRPGVFARVYHDGELIARIDLYTVTDAYIFPVTGDGGTENIIYIEPGQISVKSANCPDQICVQDAPISNAARPIICLPNRVVLQIERRASDELDAVVG